MNFQTATGAALLGFFVIISSSSLARDRLWNAFAMGCDDNHCDVFGVAVNTSSKEEAMSEATKDCLSEALPDSGCENPLIFDKCYYVMKRTVKSNGHINRAGFATLEQAKMTKSMCASFVSCSQIEPRCVK